MKYFDIHGIFYNNPSFTTDVFAPEKPLLMLPDLDIDETQRTIFIKPVRAKFMNMKNQYLQNLSSGTFMIPFYCLQLLVSRLLKEVDGGQVAIHWYKLYADYFKSQVTDKYGMNFNFFKQVMKCTFYSQIPAINSFSSREEYNEDPYTCGYFEIPIKVESGYQEVQDAFQRVWKIYNGELATGLSLTADVPQFVDPADKGDNVARTQLFFENLIPLCQQQIDVGNGGVYNFKVFDDATPDVSQSAMYEAIEPTVPPITPI